MLYRDESVVSARQAWRMRGRKNRRPKVDSRLVLSNEITNDKEQKEHLPARGNSVDKSG